MGYSGSQRELRALIQSQLGRRPVSLRPDPVGASHAVYFVCCDDGFECVLRVARAPGSDDLLEQEVWAARQCRSLGIPVPDILAYEAAPRSFVAPYMIMARLPGVPGHRARLTAGERDSVLEQLGQYLALIHRIELPAFGWLRGHGATFAGRSPSWMEHVLAQYDREARKLPGDVLDPRRAAELRVRLEREREALAVDSAVLVHGDYHLKNVLVQQARVTGILDFENLVAGDPVVDFSAVHFRSAEPAADLAAMQRGYGPSRLFEPDFMRKLYLYELTLAVAIMWWKWQFQDQAGIAAMHSRLGSLEARLDGR
ncbi:MAG: hypothetical protein CL878_15675 [Dehalococcoidia bacterium]|nr:hypothetical protein [Dehalococcoidia bacterium]